MTAPLAFARRARTQREKIMRSLYFFCFWFRGDHSTARARHDYPWGLRGLCGLTEEGVLAIAEHEHMPEIAAAAFAEYLTNQEHGTEKIRDMIVDDIRAGQARDDKEHILTLLHVLHHFLRTHPEARPEQHPWSDRF